MFLPAGLGRLVVVHLPGGEEVIRAGTGRHWKGSGNGSGNGSGRPRKGSGSQRRAEETAVSTAVGEAVEADLIAAVVVHPVVALDLLRADLALHPPCKRWR